MRSSIIFWNSSGCTSEWINLAWNSRIWWFAVILQEEDTPELQKKIQSSLKIVANQFVDPVKAEDFLHKLYQMKDNSIFKSLAVLLNYSTTISQAVTARVYLTIDPFFNLWVCLFVHCHYLNFGKIRCPGPLQCLCQWNTGTAPYWNICFIQTLHLSLSSNMLSLFSVKFDCLMECRRSCWSV